MQQVIIKLQGTHSINVSAQANKARIASISSTMSRLKKLLPLTQLTKGDDEAKAELCKAARAWFDLIKPELDKLPLDVLGTTHVGCGSTLLQHEGWQPMLCLADDTISID